MRYTEIKMAESLSTPAKTSARSLFCWLHGGSHESRCMLRIFSKARLSIQKFIKPVVFVLHS